MGIFIPLHFYDDGTKFYLNVAVIENFKAKKDETGSHIYTVNDADSFYDVKEVPSEIERLIDEANHYAIGKC